LTMNSMWPSRVLCAVDFSEPSAAALRFAARLSAGVQGSLHALHAHFWEAPAYFTESRLADLNRQFQLSKQEADRALERFITTACPHCDASRVIVDARPVDGILKFADESKTDLIVLGTHGRSGFRRFLLGSVAERVLRETTIPIVTVRAPLETPLGDLPIGKILCPVNASPAAGNALVLAARLAASLGAELNVLHVVEPFGHHSRPDICLWLPEGERQACRIQELVASGEAAEQILHLAAESSSDLLVLGAQHSPFADATVIGTTTIRVVRHSPIPVLTVVSSPVPLTA
jgi:nucleotide-binding universal stress UspA family protein